MPALAIWSPEDGVLGVVAPLALAAAAGTALVVDLDPGGPRYPGSKSLADLVADGPTLQDLEPARRGVGVLANGGVRPEDAGPIVAAVVERWPAVVLRHPATHHDDGEAIPVVPLVPGDVLPDYGPRAIYQRSGWRVPVPEGALVLPRPRRRIVEMLLNGVAPPRGDRWIASWSRLWS